MDVRTDNLDNTVSPTGPPRCLPVLADMRAGGFTYILPDNPALRLGVIQGDTLGL